MKKLKGKHKRAIKQKTKTKANPPPIKNNKKQNKNNNNNNNKTKQTNKHSIVVPNFQNIPNLNRQFRTIHLLNQELKPLCTSNLYLNFITDAISYNNQGILVQLTFQ